MNTDYKSIQVRLDKLSLTYPMPDSEHQKCIKDWLDGACEDDEGWETYKEGGMKYYRHTYIFPISGDGQDKLIVQIGPYRKNVPFVRLEWNPDKAGKSGNEIVQDIALNLDLGDGYKAIWQKAKVSCMHLSLDIPGIDIDTIQVRHLLLKKWGMWGEKNVETRYLGSKNKKGRRLFFRIYNKRTQLIECDEIAPSTLPESLTRFEAEVKPELLLFHELMNYQNHPFSGLRITNGVNSRDYKHKFFLAYCKLNGPTKALKQIPDPKTRKKYAEALKASKKLKSKWSPKIFTPLYSSYIKTLGLVPFE